ncbi:MAG: hypothetical protein ACMUIE_07570 [Thermoplasmatota archaeon]
MENGKGRERLDELWWHLDKKCGEVGSSEVFDSIFFSRSILSDENRSDGDFDEMALYPPRWDPSCTDPETRLGIFLGLALSNIPVMVGNDLEGPITEFLNTYGPEIVFSISDNRKDLDLDMLKRAKSIEIQYEKTQVMNKKGINYSDRRIPEIRKGKDLIKIVDLFKEITEADISVRIDCMDLSNDLDLVLVTRADSVVIDCLPKGHLIHSFPHPVHSLVEASRHFETFNSRKKGVKLIIDAPFRGIEDLLKMRTLGADGIGMTFLMENLSTMAAHQIALGSGGEGGTDWAEVGELCNLFIKDIMKGYRDSLSFLNITRSGHLNIDMLSTLSLDTASTTGIKLIGYGKQVPQWKH